MAQKNFKEVRKLCIAEAKKAVKESVTDDTLIVQAISSIEELDKTVNQIATRVREWYSWYNPEFSRSLSNNAKFMELIIEKDKKTLLKELGSDESMGRDLPKEDVDAILELAKQANGLIKLQEKEKIYLENILKRHCPNALEVLGCTMAAKLIRHAGSLKRLAMTPAPVIQIMGAEKALFKHMSSNAKSPKYGLIVNHQLIAGVPSRHRGKMARAIADKAALAIKVDFFKGKPIGAELVDKLNQKAASLNIKF